MKGNGGQVKKILKHLGLWVVKACPPSVWRARPPPRANTLPKYELSTDYSHRGVGPYGPEARDLPAFGMAYMG